MTTLPPHADVPRMNRAIWLCLLAACGGSSSGGADGSGASDGGGNGDGSAAHDGGGGGDGGNAAARSIIVIPFENKSDAQIFGNTTDAPYINSLLTATAARATNMQDELPAAPSEPHYIWMEAGTNALGDHTFSGDGDPTATNSTNSTAHLVTQLTAAGRTWTSYQEDITTGACPIASSGVFAAKHDPMVFFQDVVGSPPSASNAGCGAHHKAIGDFAADLQAGTIPNYAFVTPNLCHDMHGDLTCPSLVLTAANITAGDTWLSTNLPPMIAYSHTHDTVIILVWDEGDSTNKVPLLVIGDQVKGGTTSNIAYTHSSMLRTVEELLGVPVLPAAATATNLGAMFQPGYLP